MQNERLNDTANENAILAPENPKVPLAMLALILFRIGATTFGGLWAGTQKLERELVWQRGWLTVEDQKALIVAAALIPAPKFLAFGGMIGFRLRGWPGTIVGLCSILAPPALFVLAGTALLNPELLGGPMDTLRRAVGIAIIGLLFGNAFHQINSSKVPPRETTFGILIAVAVALAAILGAPLLLVAVTGLIVGGLLIRRAKEKTR